MNWCIWFTPAQQLHTSPHGCPIESQATGPRERELHAQHPKPSSCQQLPSKQQRRQGRANRHTSRHKLPGGRAGRGQKMHSVWKCRAPQNYLPPTCQSYTARHVNPPVPEKGACNGAKCLCIPSFHMLAQPKQSLVIGTTSSYVELWLYPSPTHPKKI